MTRRQKRWTGLIVWIGVAWFVHRNLPEPIAEAIADLRGEAGTAIGPEGAGILVPIATIGMALGTVIFGLLLVGWAQE